MDKLKMQTVDKADKNFKKLANMFPNAVTETIDENGNVVRAIDKDVLMQEINTKVVEGNEERYQFTWPDKKKSVLLANAPINKTLRPCREESVDFDNTENLYIEGDNLEVLKLLQETYLGKIKMIYIDPPYNTGNDFVYADDFAQSTDEYLENSGQFDGDGNRLVKNLDTNGRFHTDWLNMVYPRLKLARDLLTEDGVIFISIDDNEVNNLIRMCAEIWGRDCFLACFPRITKKAGKTTDAIARNHDYVLAFSKSTNPKLYLPSHTDEGFKFADEFETERGKYKLNQTLDYDSLQYSSSLDYPITIDGETIYPGQSYEKYLERKNGNHARADWAWRWSKELFDFGYRNGFIVVKKYENYSRIYTKTYQNAKIVKTGNGFAVECFQRTKSISTLDFVENEFSNDNSKKNLLELFENSVFDYSKPVSLPQTLSRYLTSEDDIILDFFSGSATTAHAVMQLNAEDGGRRKFIMVQLPEETDEKSEAYKAGYKNICEIGKERIRRAGKKILDESSDKEGIKKGLKNLYKDKKHFEISQDENLVEMYYNGEISLEVLKNQFKGTEDNLKEINEFIDELEVQLKLDTMNIDLGFRVLKCDSSNMKDVYYNPTDYEPSLFSTLEDNIKEDRGPEDLLFQVMLDLGVLLSSKIGETTIAGKKVFNVDGNYLIACFDENVTEEVITEIAKQKPYYFVMRDNSMANDSVATNFEQIFATYSPDTVRKVL